MYRGKEGGADGLVAILSPTTSICQFRSCTGGAQREKGEDGYGTNEEILAVHDDSGEVRDNT